MKAALTSVFFFGALGVFLCAEISCQLCLENEVDESSESETKGDNYEEVSHHNK